MNECETCRKQFRARPARLADGRLVCGECLDAAGSAPQRLNLPDTEVDLRWPILERMLADMPDSGPAGVGAVEALEEAYGPNWREGVSVTESEAEEANAVWVGIRKDLTELAHLDRSVFRKLLLVAAAAGAALGVGLDALIRGVLL